MASETQVLPSAFLAPSNVTAHTVYDGMVSTYPSFTAVDSGDKDVNTPAGAPGYNSAPNHYKGHGGIQSFDVWDAYQMDPYRATAWKYFSRYNLKGSTVNDLNKLTHYLQEAMDRVNFQAVPIIDLRSIQLTPAVVLPAFDLKDVMGEAALDFLLSFTTRSPKTYLRSSKVLVEQYIHTLPA